MLRRSPQLFIGLALYGVSTAIFVRADSGADPWNVLHLDVTNLLLMNIGMVIIIMSVLALPAWIPLCQRPGFGTLSNMTMIGLAVDAALLVTPGFESLLARSGLLVSTAILNTLVASLYIGTSSDTDPHDGLMTSIHVHAGWPMRRIRTTIEAPVLLIGWLLGGTVRVGTVLYALVIGPLTQLCLPWSRRQL